MGPAVWAGVYFGLAAGLIILCLRPFAHHLFEWAGHDPSVRILETEYFRILCIMGLGIPGVALSAFFTGRGKTLTVMWVNFAATGINILLDYAWIFGNWGFPEWGIRGAAWATVIAHFVTPVVFIILAGALAPWVGRTETIYVFIQTALSMFQGPTLPTN